MGAGHREAEAKAKLKEQEYDAKHWYELCKAMCNCHHFQFSFVNSHGWKWQYAGYESESFDVMSDLLVDFYRYMNELKDSSLYKEGSNLKELCAWRDPEGIKGKHYEADRGMVEIILYKKHSDTSMDINYSDITHILKTLQKNQPDSKWKQYGRQCHVDIITNLMNGIVIREDRYCLIHEKEIPDLEELGKIWEIWFYTENGYGHKLDENLNVVTRWLPDNA